MSLSELCTTFITKRDSASNLLDKNVIEFLEAPWGLGLGCTPDVPPLYPVQRVIIKCYYGMELDSGSNRDIIIKDKFLEKELYRFNEKEYIEYLFNEGRTNRKYIDRDYPNMVLVAGRRSGKTQVTSTIISYEVYRLLNKYSPQEFYKMMPEDEIKFTCISTSTETASELFNKVTGHIERSEFFRKYRNKPTQERMRFRTQRDLDKYGRDGRSSIVLRVAPCSARGLRGPSNMVVGLDEMAHFFADEKKGEIEEATGIYADRTDTAIYDAVTPSVATFKDHTTNKPEGKIICISSPGAKVGKFYEEYERSFGEDNQDLFLLQAPSWEVNPGIPTQYLKSKHNENPIRFKSEFGAEFSDRLFGWIDDPQIVRQNIVPGLKCKRVSTQRVPHFMGIDLGLKTDGTAICVGHWTTEVIEGVKKNMIEIDVDDWRFAKDEGKEYFDPADMADWIASFTDKFNIVKGLADQWYGMAVIPLLEKMGHKQFEYRQFTDHLNSEVFQNLLTTMISGEIRFPEGDVKVIGDMTVRDSDLVSELLSLQASQKSKYMIRVYAPERKGMHDDRASALARMVHIAQDYRNHGYGSRTLASPKTVSGYRMMKHSMSMGASLNRPTMGQSGRYWARGLSGMTGRY